MSTVAKFHIDYVQYMDADAQLTQALPGWAKDSEQLLKLYRIMRLVRVLDSKAVALQRTGKIGTYPSTLGQEAIGAAIGHMMPVEDIFVPYYRDYATQLQRGVDLMHLYRYWGGDERGSSFAHSHDLPNSVPIASQCLHAAGIAKAIQLRKEQKVVVSTCGDGATSEGDFYEALNVAGAWNLPIVFVINNNQWAISVPRKKQTACLTLAQKAFAAGFAGIQVDGNDVIAVGEVVRTALAKARSGHGPTLIEAITYRLCDHTTADDASRYRDDHDLKTAAQQEPLIRLRQYLQQQQLWDDAQEDKLVAECQQRVAATVADYLNSEPQPVSSIFDYHYANMPTSLAEQRSAAVNESQGES